MTGNYVSNNSTTADWDFKSPAGTLIRDIHFRIGVGEEFSTTDSLTGYSMGFTKGSVLGSTLILEFGIHLGSTGNTNYSYQTRADKFYVEGTIIYK